MTAQQRRSLLETHGDPGGSADYLVRLHGEFSNGDGSIRVRLTYVPDRSLLKADTLELYLSALASVEWPSLEALAVAALDDVRNELVPRWVQVVLVAGGTGRHHHTVVVEDQQPGWSNPALLSRLAPL